MSRVAVIGSNSFSGSHFVNHCLNKSHEVIGISRSEQPSSVFLPYCWNNHTDFTFYRFDLNHDLENIKTVLSEFGPEYVVNFAAQSMVGESWTAPEHWYMTNIISTVKLHDYLRTCSFLKKYVHISTPEVYGNCDGYISENKNYHPSTPYAISRASADLSLHAYFRTYDFPVIFTRAANVYGPGQQLYRIIPRAILFFLTGKKLQLHGGGESVRSFIHISDICKGTILAALKGERGDIYHFSTDMTISIFDLVKKIATKIGIPLQSAIDIVEDRKGKDNAYLLRSDLAKQKLGWSAETDLDTGIDETIRWVKSNLTELKKENPNYVHKP